MVAKIFIFLVTMVLLFYFGRGFFRNNKNTTRTKIVLPVNDNLQLNSAILSTEDVLKKYKYLSLQSEAEKNMTFYETMIRLKVLNDFFKDYAEYYKFSNESYYSIKIKNLVDVCKMISRNITAPKSELLYRKFNEAFGYLIEELVIDSIIFNSTAKNDVIKLVNCDFRESFNFFSNLIYIRDNTIILVLEEQYKNYNFNDFYSSIKTAIPEEIDLKLFFLTGHYDSLIKNFDFIKDLKDEFFSAFKDILNKKYHESENRYKIANVLTNISKEKDINLAEELFLDLSDFY
ncbi:hypothetical protein [Clostridium sp.]|uniref:hypothetical protein n=1 Tax=Clostridium sp. TaxID=1506 RepID=UPI001B6F0D24|nr:hypothetical protein [Clostridium sp.]MBP3915688.1 hypothetical protein [Clostridium sp.]